MDHIPDPSSQNKDNRKVIIIILSIIGVVSLGFSCVVFGVYYGVNTVQETKQASVTSTAVAHVTQVAGYEFFDDFSDNKNNWDTSYQYSKYWYGYLKIDGGTYAWDVTTYYDTGFYSWRTYEKVASVKDFDLSVDAKLDTPEATDMCYGVGFRFSPEYDSNDGYIFSVCDDQRFFAEYNNDDADITLVPWTRSTVIRSGDWNTLGVSARGDHFSLSINNVAVAEFTDTHRASGETYLLLDSSSEVPGTILFDNFGLQTR